MFTGIISQKGLVTAVAKRATGKKSLQIAAQFDSLLKIGESIAIDGVCLTVVKSLRKKGAKVKKYNTVFRVEAVPETLRLTTIGQLKIGDEVNLERSLSLRKRLDGHLVLGHVDGTGKVKQFIKKGDLKILSINFPKKLAPYIAHKGAVAVNGVSLTITKVENKCFSVALIPYTLRVTNLAGLKRGDKVNIEVDMIARYVVKNLKTRNLKHVT